MVALTCSPNPNAVQDNFRLPLFGDPNLSGGRDAIRGFSRWNVDAALLKTTNITERVSFGLALQAVNVFNHMEFDDPDMSLFTPATRFGLTSLQFNSPRFLSIGARIDFYGMTRGSVWLHDDNGERQISSEGLAFLRIRQGFPCIRAQ
jgi:hypothetical protein